MRTCLPYNSISRSRSPWRREAAGIEITDRRAGPRVAFAKRPWTPRVPVSRRQAHYHSAHRARAAFAPHLARFLALEIAAFTDPLRQCGLSASQRDPTRANGGPTRAKRETARSDASQRKLQHQLNARQRELNALNASYSTARNR